MLFEIFNMVLTFSLRLMNINLFQIIIVNLDLMDRISIIRF